MSIQVGRAVCFGLDPRWSILPIVNVPKDATRVKRRLRADRVGRVFVFFVDRIEEWILCPCEGGKATSADVIKNAKELWLGWIVGVNKRDK